MEIGHIYAKTHIDEVDFPVDKLPKRIGIVATVQYGHDLEKSSYVHSVMVRVSWHGSAVVRRFWASARRPLAVFANYYGVLQDLSVRQTIPRRLGHILFL